MKILVTGATGMLGAEVVPQLLKRGHEVVALSRKPATSLPQFNLSWIAGDLTTPKSIPDVKVDAVLHMAALTSFTEKRADVVQRINTWGTRDLGQWCSARGIPMYHTSTVYIAGRSGTWREDDFNQPADFKTMYEESKWLGEKYLRGNDKLRLTVFRPGILTGRHSDGASTGFNGFYKPVSTIIAVHNMMEHRLHLPPRTWWEDVLHLPPLKLPIKIKGDPESTLALTPVDWCAQVMVRELETGETGKTLHLVPNEAPKNHDIAGAICKALNITGFEFVKAPPRRDLLSLVYNRTIKDMADYLSHEPKFETSVGGTCPQVDADYIVRIIEYWRRNGNDERFFGSQGSDGRPAVRGDLNPADGQPASA